MGDALHAIRPAINLLSFTSGKKFIEALEKTATKDLPCLIILDYNIPEINGAEILEHIRKDKRYDPIVKIVWSTSNSDRFKTNCLDAGAKEYILKPSSLSGIQSLAENFLRYCDPD